MRILLANDEGYLRSVLSDVLKHDGHEVTDVSGGEALDIFVDNPFPLVIADINMVDLNGIELLKKVKKSNPGTEVIVTTNFASLDTAMSALRNGAYDYLIKNFEDFELISDVVSRAEEKIRLHQENKTLIEQLREQNEELERTNAIFSNLAMIDEESGLYNQDYFQERLVVELKRSRRHGHQFSLLFIDMKPFVHYAEKLGDTNNVIHELGGCLRSQLRRTDVIMRFNDDTVVVIIPETPKNGALCVVEKMRRVEEKFPCRGDEERSMVRVDFYIGLATFPEDGEDSTVLVQCARDLLSRSKTDQKTID